MNPLDKKTIEKETHILNVMVFEKCVIAEVIMPLNLYFQILQRLGHGRFDDERHILSQFTQDVFRVKNDKKKFFANYEECYIELGKYGIEVVNSNSNKWFRMVFFSLSEDNYEDDLKNCIDHIRVCSEQYSSSTIEGKAQLASKYLNKL